MELLAISLIIIIIVKHFMDKKRHDLAMKECSQYKYMYRKQRDELRRENNLLASKIITNCRYNSELNHWTAENIFTLNSSQSVEKLGETIRSRKIDYLNLKIHIESNEMIKALSNMLVIIQPCFDK